MKGTLFLVGWKHVKVKFTITSVTSLETNCKCHGWVEKQQLTCLPHQRQRRWYHADVCSSPPGYEAVDLVWRWCWTTQQTNVIDYVIMKDNTWVTYTCTHSQLYTCIRTVTHTHSVTHTHTHTHRHTAIMNWKGRWCLYFWFWFWFCI